MAQSLPPVVIDRGQWVDLYAATGISVGTQIIVQNIGRAQAILTESAVKPATGYGFNVIQPDSDRTNNAGNIGAWAFSSRGTKLQVEQA